MTGHALSADSRGSAGRTAARTGETARTRKVAADVAAEARGSVAGSAAASAERAVAAAQKVGSGAVGAYCVGGAAQTVRVDGRARGAGASAEVLSDRAGETVGERGARRTATGLTGTVGAVEETADRTAEAE